MSLLHKQFLYLTASKIHLKLFGIVFLCHHVPCKAAKASPRQNWGTVLPQYYLGTDRFKIVSEDTIGPFHPLKPFKEKRSLPFLSWPPLIRPWCLGFWLAIFLHVVESFVEGLSLPPVIIARHLYSLEIVSWGDACCLAVIVHSDAEGL